MANRNKLMNGMEEQDERLVDVAGAGLVLGFPKKTIYNLVHQRRIPFVKPFGKSLRFKMSDLQKIIDDSTIPALEAK